MNFTVKGDYQWINPFTAELSEAHNDAIVSFEPYEVKILRISSSK
jgi:hypothetical protein